MTDLRGLLRVVLGIGIVGGLGFLLLRSCALTICAATPHSQAVSPDGKVTAYVYQYDCGATTGFSTDVSLRRSGRGHPNSAGNVLNIAGHPDATGVSVRWTQDGVLVVRRPDRPAHREATEVMGRTITYERW